MTTGANMNLGQARVVDPILTNYARGYTQAGFIGDQLLPIATMPTRAAKRIEFGRESFRRYKIRRAPGGGIAQVSFGYDGQPVKLSQFALAGKTPVEHMEEAQQVPGIDLLTMAVDEVLQIISLEKEIQQAAAVRDASIYAASNKEAPAGADLWSDDASDPLTQVNDARETIRGRIGRRPNVLELSASVAARLRVHPKIKDNFKYTTASAISDDMLAQYFNIAKVVVGDAIVEDDQGATSDVWGNDAILAYVPPVASSSSATTGATATAAQTPVNANIRVPAFGYTYRLAGYPFVQPAEYERSVRSWLNDIFDEWSPEVVGPDAGFLFQAVV